MGSLPCSAIYAAGVLKGGQVITIRIARLLLAVCALVLASVGVDAKDQELKPEEWPDTTDALPTLKEVPGFDKIKAGDWPSTRTVIATRKRDGAELVIFAWVPPTVAEAHELVQRLILSTTREGHGHQVEKGPSGGVIGEEMWCPWSASIGPPRPMYPFAVRDGRSVLLLRFDLPFKMDKEGKQIRDERGNLVKDSVAPEDLSLIEDQATLCLDKLAKMGYTSTSAAPKS